jgi:histidyl-tRNA synthetase
MSAPTRSLASSRSVKRGGPASLLKHAADVASFYGFRPLREVEKKIPGLERRAHSFATASSVCAQHAALRPLEPVLAYWASPSPLHLPANKEGEKDWSTREVGEFGLHIVGVQDSIAEVVMLKTLSTIVTEWGVPLARVRLNALGDKDSKIRFEREVTTYLRKHQAHLGPECRDRVAREPLAPYHCQGELCRSVVESGPRAMNFLSEKSRLHFREMLEHLEKLSLPYEFDDLLMGDEREPRVLFSFDLGGEDATLIGARGGRYDDHFRKLSPRKDLSGVSASIFFRKKGVSADHFKLTSSGDTPAVYFIQLGLRAKLEGLGVVDLLRAANIPILQSFDSAKLSPQLLAAREAGVSHLLIMGQREALDRTVLVRAMDNSHQTIVELSELPRFLKTLR